MRAWRRRTLRWTRAQGIWCQSRAWEAAPTEGSVDICLASLVACSGCFVMKDQVEVCPLSRGDDVAVRLNPYPSHYSMAFAFSTLSCPHPCRLALRLTFPCGRERGLPRSPGLPGWGRHCLSAGVLCGCGWGPYTPNAKRIPFWAKPLSIFGLFIVTTFTDSSRLFALPSLPSSRPPDAGSCGVVSRLHLAGYIVPWASHHRVASVAGHGREPATACRVRS